MLMAFMRNASVLAAIFATTTGGLKAAEPPPQLAPFIPAGASKELQRLCSEADRFARTSNSRRERTN
jgi:hypothetical protein